MNSSETSTSEQFLNNQAKIAARLIEILDQHGPLSNEVAQFITKLTDTRDAAMAAVIIARRGGQSLLETEEVWDLNKEEIEWITLLEAELQRGGVLFEPGVAEVLVAINRVPEACVAVRRILSAWAR